ISHHDQRRGRDVLLHENTRLETGPVLVAGHDQCWNGDGLHLVHQVEQRWPPLLHAAHGERRAFRRMLGELIGELAPAARILVLMLHAGRAQRIALGRLLHGQLFEPLGRGFRFLGEFRALARRRAIAAARHHDRAGSVAVSEAEMKRAEAARRQADNMSLVDLQSIEHRANVIARALLRIFFLVFRDVGGRIAARVEGDAAIVLREMTDLLLPRAAIAGKFVHKDNRNPFAGFFVIELHSVVGRQMWHEFTVQKAIQKACARAERPASMVTTEPLVEPEWSDAMKAMAAPISSAVAPRPNGSGLSRSFQLSSLPVVSCAFRFISVIRRSVATGPGLIATTRIPSLALTLPSDCVKAASAALPATPQIYSGSCVSAALPTTLTITPRLRFCISA